MDGLQWKTLLKSMIWGNPPIFGKIHVYWVTDSTLLFLSVFILVFFWLFTFHEPFTICCSLLQEQPPWLDHDVEIWERFRMFEEENLCRFSLRGLNNHFVQLMSKDGESLGPDNTEVMVILYVFFCFFLDPSRNDPTSSWLNSFVCFNAFAAYTPSQFETSRFLQEVCFDPYITMQYHNKENMYTWKT